MSGTILHFIKKPSFKNKLLYAGILVVSMILITSCGNKEEKAELTELIKAEHDQVSYHHDNLIKTTDQGDEAWYYLAGDEVVSLNIPDHVSPWKREDDYIWIVNPDRKTGIMGLSGQIILPCESEKIDYHPEGNVFELYKRTEDGMQIHITDTEGNLIYMSSKDPGNDIEIVSEQAFLVQKEFEYFLIDREGQPIMAETYSHGSTYEGSGYAVLGDLSYVGKPGYKRIYRDDGTPAADGTFEFAKLTGQKEYPFLARKNETDDFYLMSAEGVPVLTDFAIYTIFKDEALSPLNGNLFYHRKGPEQSLLDKNGTVLLQTSYGPAADGTYFIGRLNLEEEPYGLLFGDGRWIVIDKNGSEILLDTAEGMEGMLYYGGNLLLEYGTDCYRIHNLETRTLIYEKETWEDLVIKGNYFAATGPDGRRLYDDSGAAAADLEGLMQAAYIVDDNVLLIVEEEGKQGLYCLRSQ